MIVVDHGIKFGKITPPTLKEQQSLCLFYLIRVCNFTFHMHHLITFLTLIIHVFHVLATQGYYFHCQVLFLN